MMNYLIHHLCGEEFWLMPEKAIYWPSEKILLVSDMHLGKAGHFRKSGLYVPGDLLDGDLYKMDELLNKYDIKNVIFLGDLFHNRHNHEWEIFGQWRTTHADVKLDLVIGNHDILGEEKYCKYSIEVHKESLRKGPFLLRHHPLGDHETDSYVLCGHIHPSYLLQGKGRQYLTFPCFIFDQRQGILPAFGRFTGSTLVKAEKKSLVYVVVESIVLKI
jgi:DNA ligase-associated metallophosphoesterase